MNGVMDISNDEGTNAGKLNIKYTKFNTNLLK